MASYVSESIKRRIDEFKESVKSCNPESVKEAFDIGGLIERAKYIAERHSRPDIIKEVKEYEKELTEISSKFYYECLCRSRIRK